MIADSIAIWFAFVLQAEAYALRFSVLSAHCLGVRNLQVKWRLTLIKMLKGSCQIPFRIFIMV